MVYQACKKMCLKTWKQIVAIGILCLLQIIQNFLKDHHYTMDIALAKVVT